MRRRINRVSFLKGFSLLEIFVGISLLAVLASVAGGSFDFGDRSIYNSVAHSELMELISAQNEYYDHHKVFGGSTLEILFEGRDEIVSGVVESSDDHWTGYSYSRLGDITYCWNGIEVLKRQGKLIECE